MNMKKNAEEKKKITHTHTCMHSFTHTYTHTRTHKHKKTETEIKMVTKKQKSEDRTMTRGREEEVKREEEKEPMCTRNVSLDFFQRKETSRSSKKGTLCQKGESGAHGEGTCSQKLWLSRTERGHHMER